MSIDDFEVLLQRDWSVEGDLEVAVAAREVTGQSLDQLVQQHPDTLELVALQPIALYKTKQNK